MNSDIRNSEMAGEDMVNVLGLADMSEEERSEFLEEVGSLVIESAVLKFMVSLEPKEQQGFEAWLETHQEDTNLLEKALEAYPLFAQTLTEEIEAFQSETKKILTP